MSTAVGTAPPISWWKEPTKEQWVAWWAACLGWTLDAFDFTIFLLIMVPIRLYAEVLEAQEVGHYQWQANHHRLNVVGLSKLPLCFEGFVCSRRGGVW
jgi:hypothetical protein